MEGALIANRTCYLQVPLSCFLAFFHSCVASPNSFIFVCVDVFVVVCVEELRQEGDRSRFGKGQNERESLRTQRGKENKAVGAMGRKGGTEGKERSWDVLCGFLCFRP